MDIEKGYRSGTLDWNRLRRVRYFIAGGAGFIGSNFVNFLLTELSTVTQVTVYDKFTYAANVRNLEICRSDNRLKIIEGDICDFTSLRMAMTGHDIVVNFAAESHVDRSIADASIFVLSNVFGTQNVLEASKMNEINLVLQVSTDEVYGSIEKGSANEESRLLPNSPYAASKAAADLLARSYAITHDLDVRITRACNNFGIYQFPEKFIPVVIRSLANKKKVPIYGTGENVREWLHVIDHCRAIQLVLEKGKKGEIYNVGSGLELSNNQLALEIAKLMGADPLSLENVEDRKGHDFRYSLDASKIKHLGFNVENSFASSLQKTVEWYLQNPNWWSPRERFQ